MQPIQHLDLITCVGHCSPADRTPHSAHTRVHTLHWHTHNYPSSPASPRRSATPSLARSNRTAPSTSIAAAHIRHKSPPFQVSTSSAALAFTDLRYEVCSQSAPQRHQGCRLRRDVDQRGPVVGAGDRPARRYLCIACSGSPSPSPATAASHPPAHSLTLWRSADVRLCCTYNSAMQRGLALQCPHLYSTRPCALA